jgi:hypothetical protein
VLTAANVSGETGKAHTSGSDCPSLTIDGSRGERGRSAERREDFSGAALDSLGRAADRAVQGRWGGEETPAKWPFYLTLQHDPRVLEKRTALYNDITRS